MELAYFVAEALLNVSRNLSGEGVSSRRLSPNLVLWCSVRPNRTAKFFLNVSSLNMSFRVSEAFVQRSLS